MVQAGPASTVTALVLACVGVLWQGLDYSTRPVPPPVPAPPSLQEVVDALQKARPSRRRRRSPQPQPQPSKGRKPKVGPRRRRRRTASASSTGWWVAALLAGLASVAAFFGLRRASEPVNSPGLADLAPGLGDNGAQSPPRPRPQRSARPTGHLGEASILDQLAAAEYRR